MAKFKLMNIEMTQDLIQFLKDNDAVMGDDPNNMPERTVRLINEFMKDRTATGNRPEKNALGGAIQKIKKKRKKKKLGGKITYNY